MNALNEIARLLKKNNNVQRKFLKVRRNFVKNTKTYVKLQKQHANINFDVSPEMVTDIKRVSRNMRYQRAQLWRFAKQLVSNNTHVSTILSMQLD